MIIWRSYLELEKIVDPIQLFKDWLSEAEEKEIRDPNAWYAFSKNSLAKRHY